MAELNTQNPKPQIEISPMFQKELRSRMRTTRTYTVLTVYLAIVSTLAMFLYIGATINAPRANSNSGTIGASIFVVLVGMQIVFVSFIAPAFTVGAISNERERQTYDLLRVTPLASQQIVISKLLSALGYTALMVLATVPLFSVAFLLGGVEMAQLFMALSVVLASAFLFTTLGLFISGRMKSTLGSTILTYVITLGLVLGVPVMLLVGGSLLVRLAGPALVSVGPASAITPGMVTLGVAALLLLSISPITATVISQLSFQATGNVMSVTSPFLYGLSGNGVLLPSPFIILTVLYVVLGFILLALTIRRVARPEQQ